MVFPTFKIFCYFSRVLLLSYNTYFVFEFEIFFYPVRKKFHRINQIVYRLNIMWFYRSTTVKFIHSFIHATYNKQQIERATGNKATILWHIQDTYARTHARKIIYSDYLNACFVCAYVYAFRECIDLKTHNQKVG